nr:serine/threonine-protein kinase PCRK1 isoform X2 [Ciona intestinalis]|eukprot:XP_018669580.1 serine/threonine-protein kinase PCRK1 isoform X2 [Ciona intestinalis]
MGPSKGDAEFRHQRSFEYGVRGKKGKAPTCRGCQTRIETGNGRITISFPNSDSDANKTHPYTNYYHIPCVFLKLHRETERNDNYRYINSIRDIRNCDSPNESDCGLINELIMDVDGKGKLKESRKWKQWREQKKSSSQASASNNGDKKGSRKRSNSKISNEIASKTSSMNSKIRKLQIKPEVQNEDPLEKEKFPPTEIREYKADELETVRGILGSGGFATVRLVFHKSFGMYAIKCMKSSKKEWENMEREIKLLEVGRHDNVLCLRGYTVWTRSCGIIIDYMQGGDLKSLLEMENIQNIKPSLKLRFMSHAASGIRFLHNAQERKRIVHHDLKPENFLLDQNLKLVISDFGGSVLGTKTIGMAGRTRGKENLHHTPIYTAPELFDTFLKTKSNSSSDVYSFAICIHATLTRTMPELGKLTAKEFQEKVKQGDRPHLGDIGALKQNLEEDKVEWENVQCLEKIMIECWDKEPSARPNMVDVDDRLMKQLDFNKDVQEHANEVYRMMALNSQSQSTQEQRYPLTDFRFPFKDPEKKKKK